MGSDTGGTFTDAVDERGRFSKVPSTPEDPGRGVRTGVAELGGDRPDVLAHGTTVATNALLERRGARVALVTTAGFEDVIEIGRQHRPSLYDPFADRPEPLVERSFRLGVRGRRNETGAEVEPLDLATLPTVPAGTEAVAVCLLHSDLDDAHERAVRDHLARQGWDVTCSSEVSPEFREYERTSTTVMNAHLRPACRTYLRGIAGLAGEVLVMTSAGALVSVERAAELPVSLLLSGPAGGVRAAAAIAAANGFPDVVTFDMGGTSTDVCLVRGGLPEPAAERAVDGLPVRLPSLDVHTIGAGGGSIARIDPGGALTVGPRSAGAVPGPACYGRGGAEPTVTDADLVAGRIPVGASFPGLPPLDLAAAQGALDRRGVSAAGVIAVVNANMERAVRSVSVERGVDPRGLALVAFGGAGPLHACDLAESLGIGAVVVPGRAGVLSAVGLLSSPQGHEVVRSWPNPWDLTGLDDALAAVTDEAVRWLGPAGAPSEASVEVAGVAAVEVAVDCRYQGQSHELRVATPDHFHEEHRRRNGYERRDHPVEVVAIRAVATRPSPIEVTDLPDLERETGAGPRVIVEPDCTVWVPDGWVAAPGEAGALVLTRRS